VASVAISLGSNVGDRLKNLQNAVAALRRLLTGLQVSSIYETQPMYVESQPPFYNAAAIGETDLGPLALIKQLKQAEAQLGRQTGYRYGPREIDLDLIAFGAAKYTFEKDNEVLLQVPHPRVAERRFVLQPLAELNPELVLAGMGCVKELLDSTADQASSVRKLSDALLPLLRV